MSSPRRPCTNCRQNKTKCTVLDNEPRCIRCTKKNFVCTFPGAHSPSNVDSDVVLLSAAPGPSAGHNYSYPSPGSAAHSPGYVPGHGYAQGHAQAAPLPFTAPPPPNIRPRYGDGIPYPDLRLGHSAALAYTPQSQQYRGTTPGGGYRSGCAGEYPPTQAHYGGPPTNP
ncbi:hypothetical protein MKEN_00015600 [Mycena kentingensis (nom. inval.)]|nr:hypothetical protein MKEN_00015600 [Mycena kentingensis (nom. inval.)]